jgi:outer membrane protein OmpA-like peptidoglycan-associated protein
MKRTFTTWLLATLLALTSNAWAQNAPPAGEEGQDPQRMANMQDPDATGTGTSDHGTVRKEDVKTWTMDIDGREWEVHPLTATYEGTTGLFHLPSAYTLPGGKWSFNIFRDNHDRDPKDLDASTHGLSVGYGLTSRFELHGTIGIQQRNDVDALFQPGYPNEHPYAGITEGYGLRSREAWETGFGDIKLGLKFNLLDDYKGDGVGLAIRGWGKLATADEDEGLGTGKPSFGADLVLSKSLGRAADIHGLIGYAKNSDPDDREVADEFRWGLGLNVPACSWIQLQAELQGYNYQGDDDGGGEDPLDLIVGPVLWIKPGWYIRPALSWNLNFDDGGLNQSSKSWTGRHLTIGYHPGMGCREVFVPPPPPPPPPSNRMPTVVCEIEKSEVTPGESVRVRATASDPDGDALTYTWTTSAGRISGTGAEATLDTTGVTPPATITVTVRVSDGRGGTAESSCSVRMGTRAVDVTRCISGGFPRNLARLNNVDKACLDDVATRLQGDPRSRVIVVGHADSTERTPDVIARKRAEAVRDYLVGRGVDASRITTRSAAATRPAQTGTSAADRAANRRVEVIFVPEGATAPEMD